MSTDFRRQNCADVLRVVSPDNVVSTHADLDSAAWNFEDPLGHFEEGIARNASNQQNSIINTC